jgi:hypothetical protein
MAKDILSVIATSRVRKQSHALSYGEIASPFGLAMTTDVFSRSPAMKDLFAAWHGAFVGTRMASAFRIPAFWTDENARALRPAQRQIT